MSTVHETSRDLEKSFSFDATVDDATYAFRLMCKRITVKTCDISRRTIIKKTSNH